MLLYRRHVGRVETEITRNEALYVIGDGRIYDFDLGNCSQSTHRGYNCILALAGLSKRSFWIICLEDFDVWEGAVDRVVSGEEADREVCREEILDDDWTNVTFRLSKSVTWFQDKRDILLLAPTTRTFLIEDMLNRQYLEVPCSLGPKVGNSFQLGIKSGFQALRCR